MTKIKVDNELVDAIQFTGTPKNVKEIEDFLKPDDFSYSHQIVYEDRELFYNIYQINWKKKFATQEIKERFTKEMPTFMQKTISPFNIKFKLGDYIILGDYGLDVVKKENRK